nr:hypothetical protein [Candidatus Enterousia merdequi]
MTQDEQDMWMTVIPKHVTGLAVFLWVDDIGIERKTKNNEPKLAFQNNYSDIRSENMIFISISKTPKILGCNSKIIISDTDIQQIKQFIILNFDLLMDYWKQKIDIMDFMEKVIFVS